MTVIMRVGEEDLAAFRAQFTGPRLLRMLREVQGRLWLGWPIGVGKSFAQDAIIEAAIQSDLYDLILVLLPTREVLNERRWIRNPPADIPIVNVRPRPRSLCGALDVDWLHFERAGLGALARVLLCDACPHRSGCFWPTQYADGLLNARVVFATQAHLGINPFFIATVARIVGAQRVLTLIDEDTIAATSFRRQIARSDIEQILTVLDQIGHAEPAEPLHRWAYTTRLLLAANTTDLRCCDWRWPRLPAETVLAIQQSGWEIYGHAFRYIGHALESLGQSPLASREQSGAGDIYFSVPPWVGTDVVVFSGTANPELLNFRLDSTLAAPFADYRFRHPETRWYNIASRTGMKAHFPNNADQILDFFAQLVDRRLREGQRPLLIAKKCFKSVCADGMTARLRQLGWPDAQIVTADWGSFDLEAPGVIPLINYGIVGVNLFSRFTCAFCLTGYYVNEQVVNAMLQDLLASDGYVPIQLRTEGQPRRRTAQVRYAAHRYYDINRLAQFALDRQELGVVLQAVGRVRPYTQAREIISFQCAEHPQLAYTREFNSLAEAREFFGVPTGGERRQQRLLERIEQLRQARRTQAQVAAELCVGIATVKRYWKRCR